MPGKDIWCENLPIERKFSKIAGMEKVEIKQIGQFVKDLEEGLAERDAVALQAALPELYNTIKKLMDATFETKDQQLKVLLATLELRARKCKQFIEETLAVRN